MNNEFDLDLESVDEEYLEKTNKVVKRRKDMLSFLPTVFMVLLLFAVSSVSSLIHFQFSLNEVVWSTLVLTIGLRLTMLLSAQWIGADGRYHADQKNEDVCRSRQQFIDASEKIDITVFDKWILRENIRRKTEAYKSRNNKKIAALDIKLNRIKRKMMSSPSEGLKRKLRRLARKKEDIEALNSDEFIKRHIFDLRVKYTPLRSADFLTPSEFLTKKNEKYSMSEARENMSEIFKFMPVTIFITVWFALVGTSYYWGTLNIVSIIFDTFSTALHFSTGWFYVGRRTVSTLIFVFKSRKAVIDRHLAEIAPKKEACEDKKEEVLLPAAE